MPGYLKEYKNMFVNNGKIKKQIVSFECSKKQKKIIKLLQVLTKHCEFRIMRLEHEESRKGSKWYKESGNDSTWQL